MAVVLVTAAWLLGPTRLSAPGNGWTAMRPADFPLDVGAFTVEPGTARPLLWCVVGRRSSFCYSMLPAPVS